MNRLDVVNPAERLRGIGLHAVLLRQVHQRQRASPFADSSIRFGDDLPEQHEVGLDSSLVAGDLEVESPSQIAEQGQLGERAVAKSADVERAWKAIADDRREVIPGADTGAADE
ncbi:MAG: hypothetical protein Q7S20_02285 [Gemmatimonadaceae bacterium]|nr:hypothetical protein [Gemmatimonadaceae bacterium]